jgi:hypothetical protein
MRQNYGDTTPTQEIQTKSPKVVQKKLCNPSISPLPINKVGKVVLNITQPHHRSVTHKLFSQLHPAGNSV